MPTLIESEEPAKAATVNEHEETVRAIIKANEVRFEVSRLVAKQAHLQLKAPQRYLDDCWHMNKKAQKSADDSFVNAEDTFALIMVRPLLFPDCN